MQKNKTESKAISIRGMDTEVYHKAKMAALKARLTIGRWLMDAILEKMRRGE